jgi:hypothetical protein
MLNLRYGSINRLVNGPNVAGTGLIYLTFIAYVVYDSIYEAVLCETPLADLAILVHHLLYMGITWLLYADGSFPLLVFILYSQELSTPFLNIMHAMKFFSLESTRGFTVNAWALTATFFIFRVIAPGVGLGYLFLNPPTVWSVKKMIIISCVTFGYCMQVFWFTKIAKGLMKHMYPVEAPKTEESNPLLNADIAAGGSQ